MQGSSASLPTACTAGSLTLNRCPPPTPAPPPRSFLLLAGCHEKDKVDRGPALRGTGLPGQPDSMLALPFGLVTFVPS